MDVAIRIANWLMAYDIFVAYGAKFNNIYIADTNNHRIIKLSENFSFQGFIGKYDKADEATLGWKKENYKTLKGNTPVRRKTSNK